MRRVSRFDIVLLEISASHSLHPTPALLHSVLLMKSHDALV